MNAESSSEWRIRGPGTYPSGYRNGVASLVTLNSFLLLQRVKGEIRFSRVEELIQRQILKSINGKGKAYEDS